LRSLPRNVVALGVASLLNDAASEMVIPLLPVFLGTIGGGAIALGWIEGLADGLSSVLKLWSGRLADRMGRHRPLVAIGYAITALSRPLMGLATSPLHVLAVRLADRTGKGLRTSPRDAMLAASVPDERRARAFSFHRAMDHAGAIVGPLTALALLRFGGVSLQTLFLLSAIPGLLVVVAIVVGVREVGQGTPTSAPAPALAAFRELRPLLVPIGVFALGNASDVFLLLKAGATRAPIEALPLLWVALHVVKVVSSLFAGGLADRFGKRRIVALGWGIYALVYVGFAFAQTPAQVAVLFVVYGTYHGLTEGSEKALVASLVPAERRGAAFGAYHLVVGILAIPSSVIFGVLWTAFDPAVAFVFGAALALLAIPLLALSGRAEK